MKEIAGSFCFHDSGSFVIKDFSIKRPFSSFLPGIAGPLGIPMWVFYVNRGQAIADRQIRLNVAPEDFIAVTLAHAEQHFEATFGEGYWIDHWFYNLDLIDSFLAVYPDKKDELLFGKPIVPFFDSPAVVQPRSQKYVLAGDRIRQYGAVREDEEKAELIASRTEMPNLMRTAHGRGEVYRTTVFGKLLCLVMTKFATVQYGIQHAIDLNNGIPPTYFAYVARSDSSFWASALSPTII